MDRFGDPLFSAKKASSPPQKEYSGASGSQKAPKMEPKIDTFADLWNLDFCCYLLGLDHFGGSPNDSKMGSFFEGLLGASFFRSRAPKIGTQGRFEPILGRIWASLGATFGAILAFFGGSEF